MRKRITFNKQIPIEYFIDYANCKDLEIDGVILFHSSRKNAWLFSDRGIKYIMRVSDYKPGYTTIDIKNKFKLWYSGWENDNK